MLRRALASSRMLVPSCRRFRRTADSFASRKSLNDECRNSTHSAMCMWRNVGHRGSVSFRSTSLSSSWPALDSYLYVYLSPSTTGRRSLIMAWYEYSWMTGATQSTVRSSTRSVGRSDVREPEKQPVARPSFSSFSWMIYARDCVLGCPFAMYRM